MKTVVNLTWDRRGFPQLYKHAQMLVDSGAVDTHAKALDLTGTQVRTQSDVGYLRQILQTFNPSTARLCDMGLTDCKPLQGLFGTTWWRNRKLDMSGNSIPKKELRRLITILEKHCTDERKTYFLAVGGDRAELLRGSCDPNGYCPCARGTVHIITHLRILERPSTPSTPSTAASDMQQMEVCAAPPGLSESETTYNLAQELSTARQAMQARETEAIDEGDAVMLGGRTYFVQTCPRHTISFVLVNLSDVDEHGCALELLSGSRLKLEDLRHPAKSEHGFIGSVCPFGLEAGMSPKAYLQAEGGEKVAMTVRGGNFVMENNEAWVSVSLCGEPLVFKWFPLVLVTTCA